MAVVRIIWLVLLFSLSAQADLVFWSPAGQNLTYVLPQGLTPETYLENTKNNPNLDTLTKNMRASSQDVVTSVQTDSRGSLSRSLLVANSPQDHEKNHRRVDEFGRHFEKTYVYPVGAALKLNSKEEQKFYEELTKHFGLFVFMGGDDKHPGLYGEKITHSHVAQLNRTRDILEQKLIRFVYFHSNRKIFGICRGLQQVFTALGGKLHQDINEELITPRKHSGGTHHSLEFFPTQSQILRNLMETLPAGSVDSHHHQAINESSVIGTIFNVAAKSPDGVVEAVEASDRILLLQFHVEKSDNLPGFTESFFENFKRWIKMPAQAPLVKECRKLLEV